MAVSVNWPYVYSFAEIFQLFQFPGGLHQTFLMCAHWIDNVTLANAMRHPCNRSTGILRDELPFAACIACASVARSAIPPCKALM